MSFPALTGEASAADAAAPTRTGTAWGRDRPKPLPLGLGALDARLPDAGLPRGAVVELCAPPLGAGGLGQATRLALGACRAAQTEARSALGTGHERGWCAWIDATGSLYAPGARAAGVDLERLLVVRPPSAVVGRTAVRVAQSQLFAVLVVDHAGIPGADLHDAERSSPARLALAGPDARRGRERWDLVVRRLALAIEGSDTTVVLLTRPSPHPLPVALRLELACPAPRELRLLVGKERHGRLGGPYSVAIGY
ncbi:MAG: recombinase A [Polyangiaceae bacterium]|nr:recombinase A [Polyangiaceae bacterium]